MKCSEESGFVKWLSFKRGQLPTLVLAFGSVAILGVLSATSPAMAQDPEMLLKLTEAVRKTCLVPSEKGSYFAVEGEAGAEGGVGLKLRFLEGNISGNITKKEWEGIQDVFDKERATDRDSARDCVRDVLPRILEAFGVSKETRSLLEKEMKIQEDFNSDNPAGRLVAFREAFKSIQVFFVDLTPQDGENAQSINNEINYEQSLSKNIKTYNLENGRFRDDKRQDFYALSGQISQDSITFRNNYCSGNLRHQPGTWSFRGPVSCVRGKYEGVFNLK